jgi:DNA-binding transcriptional ArsR family regulator
VFDAVGRHLSVWRAAEELSLDHSVVSRHLRALQDELGVRLVEPRQMFQEILRLIAELRPQAPPPPAAGDADHHAFKHNRQEECVHEATRETRQRLYMRRSCSWFRRSRIRHGNYRSQSWP